jgi:Mrp family chromosome partitioning ATPase
LLRGNLPIADAIHETAIPKLWLLPAGRTDAAALSILAQGALRVIFESLRPQYDFLVVDSCPVLAVSDPLLVAPHADGVVFSLLNGVSRLPKVYAAYQRLALLNVCLLGAVVNRMDEERAPQKYYNVVVEGSVVY